MTRYVGIDPGKSGGVAFIDREHVGAVHMPDTIMATVALLQLILRDRCHVILESVHAIPGTGSTSSAFTFGRGFGELRGVIATLATDADRVASWDLVTPQKWQAGLGLPKGLQGAERKRALKDIALRKFCENAKLVTLATCDALLLADWLRSRPNG